MPEVLARGIMRRTGCGADHAQRLTGRRASGEGDVVDSFGDAGDDGVASGFIGPGVSDEDSESETAAVGEGDEADVIGGGGDTLFLTGGAGAMGKDGAGGEAGANAMGAYG